MIGARVGYSRVWLSVGADWWNPLFNILAIQAHECGHCYSFAFVFLGIVTCVGLNRKKNEDS